MIVFYVMYEFFKVGLFAIGGGPATIPFLYDLSDSTKWFSVEQLTNMIAISQCTPGPLGINMATYVGYEVAGIMGGVFATLSLVLPSLIIVIGISKVLDAFKENRWVKIFFKWLRPCVLGFILSAGVSIFMSSVCDVDAYALSKSIFDLFAIQELALFIIMLIFIYKVKKHPIVYMGIAMMAGILFQF